MADVVTTSTVTATAAITTTTTTNNNNNNLRSGVCYVSRASSATVFVKTAR
jgi:hypothetical protein